MGGVTGYPPSNPAKGKAPGSAAAWTRVHTPAEQLWDRHGGPGPAQPGGSGWRGRAGSRSRAGGRAGRRSKRPAAGPRTPSLRDGAEAPKPPQHGSEGAGGRPTCPGRGQAPMGNAGQLRAAAVSPAGEELGEREPAGTSPSQSSPPGDVNSVLFCFPKGGERGTTAPWHLGSITGSRGHLWQGEDEPHCSFLQPWTQPPPWHEN